MVTQIVAVAGMTLCIASYLLKTHQLLLFYPVVVNSVMLAVFGGSLWSTMPIIERLARLREPDLRSGLYALYPARHPNLVRLFSSLTVALRFYRAVWRSVPVDGVERHDFLSADGRSWYWRVAGAPAGNKTR